MYALVCCIAYAIGWRHSRHRRSDAAIAAAATDTNASPLPNTSEERSVSAAAAAQLGETDSRAGHAP
eukprot:3453512-Prymnesium_polylepis.1